MNPSNFYFIHLLILIASLCSSFYCYCHCRCYFYYTSYSIFIIAVSVPVPFFNLFFSPFDKTTTQSAYIGLSVPVLLLIRWCCFTSYIYNRKQNTSAWSSPFLYSVLLLLRVLFKITIMMIRATIMDVLRVDWYLCDNHTKGKDERYE